MYRLTVKRVKHNDKAKTFKTYPKMMAWAEKMIRADLEKTGEKERLIDPKTESRLKDLRCFDFLRLSDRTLYVSYNSDR